MLLVKCYKYKTFTRIDCSSSLCGHNKTHFGLFLFFFHHMRTPYAVIHHFLALLCSKQQTCFLFRPISVKQVKFPSSAKQNYPTQVTAASYFCELYYTNAFLWPVCIKISFRCNIDGSLLQVEKQDKLMFYSADNLCRLDVDTQQHLVCIVERRRI